MDKIILAYFLEPVSYSMKTVYQKIKKFFLVRKSSY